MCIYRFLLKKESFSVFKKIFDSGKTNRSVIDTRSFGCPQHDYVFSKHGDSSPSTSVLVIGFGTKKSPIVRALMLRRRTHSRFILAISFAHLRSHFLQGLLCDDQITTKLGPCVCIVGFTPSQREWRATTQLYNKKLPHGSHTLYLAVGSICLTQRYED